MSSLYWLTGLSGAGKTTIGKLFYSYLKENRNNVVYLDGDVLREIFGATKEYDLQGRKDLAMRYSYLCKMLVDQGIDVVIATISMFHDVRNWNRDNIENYCEIYIKVPIEVLIERDQKNLYSRALNGDINHVMGIDVDVEEPSNPDCVIENDGKYSPKEMVSQLINQLRMND